MNEQAQQLVTRLNEANNVLLTVAANPTVDQLAAVIGLTLLLNKQGKHATAVFSGQVPSTIEFLQPDKTLEKNTDSLRDFIISLDKAKADKLRYKVEDKLVKIFITPYRTSIGENDLEFSQGDFNVEVVIALGVADKNDLDQAIASHGRILHDATVATVSTKAMNGLGTIHWVDDKASSLCEMVVGLSEQLGVQQLDAQIATALLTGIVAETARFSNEKTSSNTMAISAKLMAAGANQQLVATQLQEVPKAEPTTPLAAEAQTADVKPEAITTSDGSLKIDHQEPPTDLPQPSMDNEEDDEDSVEKIRIDEHGTLHTEDEINKNNAKSQTPSSTPTPQTEDVTPAIASTNKIILEPPTMGGKLTANSEPEQLDPSTDPLSSVNSKHRLLSHDSGPASATTNPTTTDESATDIPETGFLASPPPQPAEAATTVAPPVKSDEPAPAADLDNARSAVEAAMGNMSGKVEPIAALNAVPVELPLGPDAPAQPSDVEQPKVDESVASDPGLPPGILPSEPTVTPPAQPATPSSTTPPPVPPPMMPPMMPPSQPKKESTDNNGQPLVL